MNEHTKFLRDVIELHDASGSKASGVGLKIEQARGLLAEIERLEREELRLGRRLQDEREANRKLANAHEPLKGETFPAFMYCPTCSQLYTGRGGQDGYPMMLTCPNHHTWQDPRPVEGASRDAYSTKTLWDCACNLTACPYCGPRLAQKSGVSE